MIYIGHSYHLHTQSTRFLIEIFNNAYQIDEVTYDMDTGEFNLFDFNVNKNYDVLVLFQMPISPAILKSKFHFKKAAYFPMYDGTGEHPPNFWIEYKDFNIINFSRTLHNRLLDMGLSSYYIQYYSKPVDKHTFSWGDTEKAFFWQRTNNITINSIIPLLKQLDVTKIHMHIANDPGSHNVQPEKDISNNFDITTSRWFDTKSDMYKEVVKSAYYVAPRIYEGIGMSFLEAMAMGRCVIAVNHPTMNEYILDGVNGLLYNYDKTVLVKPNDVHVLQKNAYESALAGYSTWERDKLNILLWLEKKISIDKIKFRRTLHTLRFSRVYYFGKLLMLSKSADEKYFLFGKIHIPVCVINAAKRIYHLK